MKKGYSLLITVSFCLFLGGIMGANLLIQDRSFSPWENRYLTQAPALSPDGLASGAFMAQAERYVNDQFVLRDGWVVLKAQSERLTGKGENNGIYFGNQDTLIKRVEAPDMTALRQKLSHIDALDGNVAVPVYFGLIPTAAAIFRDRLPSGAPTADELAIIGQLYDEAGVTTIPVAEGLLSHQDQPLFYRTDHHWTSLGAYYGYAAVMEGMGIAPAALPVGQKQTVSRDFLGTAIAASGAGWVPPDEIDTYIPEDSGQVTSFFTELPTPGALYVADYLSQRDQYSFFLGGNQPLCVIDSAREQGLKVLLIRDSYADSMAPFFTQSVSELHLLDLRFYRKSVQEYVAEHQIDAVVVLYSFFNFTSDNNLFLLGR